MTTSDEGESLYIDFLTLAIQDEAFGKIYQRNGGAVDFKNPEDVQYWLSLVEVSLVDSMTNKMQTADQEHPEAEV